MPDQVIQKKLTDEQRKWVQCGMSRTDSLVHFLSKLCIPIPQELTAINTRLREMDTFGTSDGKAEAFRAALVQEQSEPDAYGYASSLAVAIWEKHYKDKAPDWKPFNDLMGVLTQIDNMTAGLTRQQVEPEPEIPPGYRKAEPDEWKRTDVKCWSRNYPDWRDRTFQGDEFDPPDSGTHYIVPCRHSVPEGWRVANEDEYHRSDIMTWEGSHDGDRGYWRRRPSHKVGKPFNGPDYLYIVPIDAPLTDEDACVWPRPLVMVRDEDYHLWEGPFRYIGKDDDKTGLVYLIFRKDEHRWYKQARRATPAEIEAAK